MYDPLGCGQFETQGLDWQDLCRGPLHIATYSIYKLWASWFQRRLQDLFTHCYILNIYAVGLMVSEKKIFFFSMGANDRRGRASLDLRDLIGRIYVVDHTNCYILNI